MKKTLQEKLFSLFAAAFILAAFSACKYEGDTINVIKNVAYEENKNFESISFPLISGTDDHVEETIFARVYDKNEYLPYAGIRYWLEYLKVSIESMSYSDGEYTITGKALGKTFPLVVNVKNSTIYCPTWAGIADPKPGLYFYYI